MEEKHEAFSCNFGNIVQCFTSIVPYSAILVCRWRCSRLVVASSLCAMLQESATLGVDNTGEGVEDGWHNLLQELLVVIG